MKIVVVSERGETDTSELFGDGEDEVLIEQDGLTPVELPEDNMTVSSPL